MVPPPEAADPLPLWGQIAGALSVLSFVAIGVYKRIREGFSEGEQSRQIIIREGAEIVDMQPIREINQHLGRVDERLDEAIEMLRRLDQEREFAHRLREERMLDMMQRQAGK